MAFWWQRTLTHCFYVINRYLAAITHSVPDFIEGIYIEGMFNSQIYLTRREAARLSTLSKSFLAHVGDLGPPVVRVGRRILYNRTDLLAWLDSHRVARRPRGRGRPRKGAKL